MTETDFYALIDAARPSTSPESPSADADDLREVLAELPDDQVAAFSTEFRRQLVRLNQWSLWDAGYAASGGMGDDAFHYFRCWLIGKGAAIVDLALADPEKLVPYLDTDELENELLEYAADDVLEDRGIDVNADDDVQLTDAEPAGEPFDEDTSELRHPKLAVWWSEVSGGFRADDTALDG
ncbi:DUF4240 domain-containing protein [Agromyces sp. Soil535]|uniref:DUF4240 domain-containing protein n=1 Tax=Agromyces sp. Soil535 TaxID=1736390 RepID=UPI0006F595D9|nr:DUF4240 domain-containing protein [Agromyces sp. Soil535]KRE30431.1 hypothetical protein ASG80_16880 [Agromyces sp. Soil535]